MWVTAVCIGKSPFQRLWIQPAAGDAGSALGAALWTWYNYLGNSRYAEEAGSDFQQGSFLGPSYTGSEIKQELAKFNANYKELSETEILKRACSDLQDGKVVGWFSGRMEFGPRALGARSILGDPRSAEMQSIMNLKIKFRESFRPFAPIILAEKVNEWFDVGGDNTQDTTFSSPYMLIVAKLLEKHRKPPNVDILENRLNMIRIPRSNVPAITHVDYSARLQSVHAETNPRLHKLLSLFDEKTKCPILVNTSFNVRGEPVVASPSDAYRCFMRTEMDVLVLENYILYKDEQPVFIETEDWHSVFELD